MEYVNDIFVQHMNGLPFIAKCYGGDYCVKHTNHSLVTGFFSALNSFKSQFKQKSLKLVEFNELRVLFENKNDIMVVLTLDCNADLTSSRELAKDILNKFHNDCFYNQKYSMLKNCEKFNNWLDITFGKPEENLDSKISN